MSFVLKMVVRELRASWRRLLFFFICVAIGVAAIVTLRSIIQSLRTGLMREARATIASDVLVQSSRPWTPEVRSELEQQIAAAPVQDRTESIETATMVRAENGNAVARMVELRGSRGRVPLLWHLRAPEWSTVLPSPPGGRRHAGATGVARAARREGWETES